MIDLNDPALREGMRIVAVVDAKAGYHGLVDAFAKRIADMGVGLEEIDERSKLADFYVSKVINRIRNIGLTSLGPMLQATDLMLVIAVNPNAAPHDMRPKGTRGPPLAASEHASKRKARLARIKLLQISMTRSASQRKVIATHAATIRWQREREIAEKARRWKMSPAKVRAKLRAAAIVSRKKNKLSTHTTVDVGEHQWKRPST